MTHRRPRVLFWDNLPTPYGVEQYNLLADRACLDLSVWFSKRTEPDRSWVVDEPSWRFAAAYIEDPSRSIGAARRFVERCRAASFDVMVAPYGEPRYVAGILLAAALGIRTCLVVQRTFDAWVARSWWKEAVKTTLFRSADAAQVPGPDGAEYARRYGFPGDRIFSVTLTINLEQYSRRLSEQERRAHRARFGVGGCVFLYAGRLWKPKGVLHLIDAFRQARRVNDGISLLLVGDGADEAELRAAAADVPCTTFWPFVQASELCTCYGASDVFVFPTLGDPHGQVIEEAHAAGLPIVTTDAVGDIHRRVRDGVNGFVVPAGNPTIMAERMLALADRPQLRTSMGAHGAHRAAAWGHEVYAREVEQMIGACLAAESRSGVVARVLSTTGRLALSLGASR